LRAQIAAAPPQEDLAGTVDSLKTDLARVQSELAAAQASTVTSQEVQLAMATQADEIEKLKAENERLVEAAATAKSHAQEALQAALSAAEDSRILNEQAVEALKSGHAEAMAEALRRAEAETEALRVKEREIAEQQGAEAVEALRQQTEARVEGERKDLEEKIQAAEAAKAQEQGAELERLRADFNSLECAPLWLGLWFDLVLTQSHSRVQGSDQVAHYRSRGRKGRGL
jgi:colicin import membrane protein